MNNKTWLSVMVVLTALFFGLGPQRAFADETVNVTVNTSGLPATPGSEIVFVLTDGSGLNDANNTATLSGFGLGGGLAGAVDTLSTMGGATGNLSSGVALIDSSFSNVFAQFFTSGAQLSFLLDLTTKVDAGLTPDQFSMYIYDPSTNSIATTSDPTGLNSLLTINLDSSNPTIFNYDSALVSATAPVTPTPEPATLLLLGSGLISLGLLRRRAIFSR